MRQQISGFQKPKFWLDTAIQKFKWKNNMILLVGAGYMAQNHAKVLSALGKEYIVVGRGEETAQKFEKETGHYVIRGGIKGYLATIKSKIDTAIITLPADHLKDASIELIKYGVTNILAEKPAGLNVNEINELSIVAEKLKATVFVAYNRRFFSSVSAAQKIINDDGGVTSFNFEITEWGHVIAEQPHPKHIKDCQFLCNTSHVVDLAFYLGGKPKDIACFTEGSTDWHSRSAVFSGAGQTVNGSLFAYHGNWNAPGRWSVEMLTNAHRLILRPMEQLQIQKIGSVAIEEYTIDDELDLKYKPGLYRQLETFLSVNKGDLCTIHEHLKNCQVYAKMANY